jgi:transcriptional regulator with XRE-family HTH domain
MKLLNKKKPKHDACQVETGVRFRIFRDIIDRTREQLAAELDIPASAIEDIETGRCFPKIIYLHYLSEKYNLDINWMVGKPGDMFTVNDRPKLIPLDPPPPPPRNEEPSPKKHIELLELMELPIIKESIMAALLEIKTLLKKQNRERMKKRPDNE